MEMQMMQQRGSASEASLTLLVPITFLRELGAPAVFRVFTFILLDMVCVVRLHGLLSCVRVCLLYTLSTVFTDLLCEPLLRPLLPECVHIAVHDKVQFHHQLLYPPIDCRAFHGNTYSLRLHHVVFDEIVLDTRKQHTRISIRIPATC